MKFLPRRRLTTFVAESGCLDARPLVLLDVGCRGGVHRIWREFGDALLAYGFDPASGEAERCQAQETHPAIEYFPHLIGTGENALAIDEFVRREGLDYVDFLKIDTDGMDLDVLRSCTWTLEDRGVLGALVEVPFHGTSTDDSNTFHNIDRLMKSNGFAIYDIDVQRYAHPALPLPHDREQTSTSVLGQPKWADVLFLREHDDITPLDRIKLACMAEIFRTPDTAASLIAGLPENGPVNKTHCLDLLVYDIIGAGLNYIQYMEKCEDDPNWLRPSRRSIRGGLDLHRALALLAKATAE